MKKTIIHLMRLYFIGKSAFGAEFDLFDRDLALALPLPQPMYVDIVAGLKINAELPEVFTTYLYEREGT